MKTIIKNFALELHAENAQDRAWITRFVESFDRKRVDGIFEVNPCGENQIAAGGGWEITWQEGVNDFNALRIKVPQNKSGQDKTPEKYAKELDRIFFRGEGPMSDQSGGHNRPVDLL